MKPARRTTVLLADDHAIVREGLVSLLKDYDFDVVGAVGDGLALVEAAQRLLPDVIITDLSMPGLSGLEVIVKLKQDDADRIVIVLTMHDDPVRATQALKAGASGFVLKESAGEELVTAIHRALRGHVHLTAAVTKAVIAQIADGDQQPTSILTARQIEVLRLTVKGLRMKEIASNLNLSPRTVETHKYEMMQALGLHSTAELVTYAIKHHLVGD